MKKRKEAESFAIIQFRRIINVGGQSLDEFFISKVDFCLRNRKPALFQDWIHECKRKIDTLLGSHDD